MHSLNMDVGINVGGIAGSGKTALARAASTEAAAKLLVVNGADIATEFFGESEAGLRGVFAAAKALAPAVSSLHPHVTVRMSTASPRAHSHHAQVVFIDEIDALAPSRTGTGVSARLVATLLTEMDALQGWCIEMPCIDPLCHGVVSLLTTLSASRSIGGDSRCYKQVGCNGSGAAKTWQVRSGNRGASALAARPI